MEVRNIVHDTTESLKLSQGIFKNEALLIKSFDALNHFG